MDLIFFFEGVAIGFLMAVPIGPIGMLCIRMSMKEGIKRGMIIGLGAASADFLFSLAAILGISYVTDFIARQETFFRLLGGTILLLTAFRIIRKHPVKEPAEFKKTNWSGIFISTILLTLTNPATIFAFIAVFAGLGITDSLSLSECMLLSGGIFTGSVLWFLLLSTITTLISLRINFNTFKKINTAIGVLILISAISAFAGIFI